MKLSEELKYRGFVNQTTFSSASELDQAPLAFYLGVDPSADSMQVGNLAVIMLVRQFIKHGHKAFLLIGGATGMIGDPDGKATERDLKSEAQVASNKRAIAGQFKRLLENEPFEIVDNYDWFKKMNYLEFLRDVGKRVPLRQMLARDFVASRLDTSGISYAEFSYVLIQAYDFLHLFREHGVTLQICGADQWGNSIAGVDLIRRVTSEEVNVWSAPLVIDKSTGRKFGKSESGAIWLDAKKTSPFKFYQFWLNTDDASALDFLKIYTTLEKPVIENIASEFASRPKERLAQKTLAFEVTKIVHGEAQAASVRNATDVLFGNANFRLLGASELTLLKNELATVRPGPNLPITLASAGLAKSASDARRLITSGAVSLNGQKVASDEYQIQPGHNLLKVGKNKFALVEN